eukprot:12701-Heterococcus_DN1.PRE.2
MCRINHPNVAASQASNKAIQNNNRAKHTEQALKRMKRMAPVSLNEAIEQSAQLCTRKMKICETELMLTVKMVAHPSRTVRA